VIKINTNPSVRELRQFAGIWMFAALIFLGAWLYCKGSGAAFYVWGTGAAIALLGLVLPNSMRGLFVVLQYAAFPFGWVMSHIILAVVFFAVLTPLGLLKRMVAGDRLARKPDPAAKSYWVPHAASTPHQDYFKQY
jgi:hypothetical protein